MPVAEPVEVTILNRIIRKMKIFKYLNMLAAALALSAGIAYAQDDCGCDSCCVVDSKPKYVALSFDDGPSLKCTPMMLDVLEENGVKASFFLIGQNITDETAPIIRRMVRMGCDVENHTYSHPNLTQIPDAQILEEVAKTDSLIEVYAGAKPRYLRPPFTAHSAHVAEVVGGKIFIAGLSCRDWRADMPVEDRVTMTLTRVEDGRILLFHDTNERTVEAMKAIIPRLKALGYEFVTIPELFHLSGQTPADHSPKMYGRAY